MKEKTVVRDGPVKGEVNLRQALERSGVRVEKAPVGMSRSKLNRTGWNRKYVLPHVFLNKNIN